MEYNRPKQHKQSSRKGKKAWVKNIDLEDISKGLEEQRENLIKFGVESLDDLQASNLFVVDTKGDEKLKSKTTKILKSTEILNRRSKVPGLENAHKKKDYVSKSEVKRLMQAAGRDRLASSSSKARVAKEGIVNAKAYDVWDQAPSAEEINKPEILKQKSASAWTTPSHKPSTLLKPAIQVKEIEEIPHAGKSYNPSLESWKGLINKEYLSEKVKEDRRLALEQERKKIQGLIETLDDKEEDDSESESEQESTSTKKSDGLSDDEEEEAGNSGLKLSLNKPVVNKKKTKTQRNRQKKHQERVKLEAELKQLKIQLQQLAKIPTYKEELDSTGTVTRTTKEELVSKRHKLGTKYEIKDPTLEIKLSDELTDSLRSLKPEGNLFYDNWTSLQSKGKIETRVVVKKRRRYNPKITEKWTYKDFK